MKRKKHYENCHDCKDSVRNLLANLFGIVEANRDINLSSLLADYKETKLYGRLEGIHTALQNHRGFNLFVKQKKLPPVDYFVPARNLIVEFDESQHFTKPRDIALSLYPEKYGFGFSISRWRSLCQELDRRDNDPIYRDEQRAWYDTLRDFAPLIWGNGQTVRLYSRDLVWCSLNPDREDDLKAFERLVGIRKDI